MKKLFLLILLSQMAMAADPKVAGLEPKIIYEQDPTLLTSTIQVVVLTGAADDPAAKKGLSNIMSELMLRGTKKRSRTKFQSEIERMGASLSVRSTNENLVFVGRVIKENTNEFLKLLSEALLKPAFNKKEFDALKTETIAEIANMKNSNGRLSGLAMRREIMRGTALEKPIEGTLSTVKAIQLDDVVRAYNDHFNRASFVFAVASPLNEAEIKDPLTAMWLAFPDGAKRVYKSIAPKVPSKPELILVEKPKTSTGALMFGQAGIVARDPLRYALSVGNFSFGGEPLVSRLFRTVRSELGWTYAIGSTYHAAGALSNQQGFFVISSTPSVEFTARTILKVLAMWREYVQKGLAPEELKLARESLINSYPFDFDSAEKRLWQKLHGYLYDVPVLSPEDYAKTINAVTNDNIIAALKERQENQGFVISVVADRAVIEKQLAQEQKDIPADKRLVISKQISPEELIR